ncbi:hypothetical protein KFL_001960110 [Klebsormidium nitens]|uniref:Guanylate cyclase domain-containing protein n=1 Tax=Klebsormidium nitens TaxID=105231 RepID=A0A1Y1I118_KLENI|nr:hypothetical protein KFL_001960110 [Klebsormidium nitens]|eukprot:GAQ84594.1 hypothetical protein KFL_001960110 [Klebsormidium nitens]
MAAALAAAGLIAPRVAHATAIEPTVSAAAWEGRRTKASIAHPGLTSLHSRLALGGADLVRMLLGENDTPECSWRVGEWSDVGTAQGLPHNRVNVLRIDGQERLWVGSRDGGLAVFDGSSSEAFLPAFSRVNDLQLSPRDPDALWLATDLGAVKVSKSLLFAKNADGSRMSPIFQHFTVNDGLPSSNVEAVSVRPTDGTVWFATEKGVACHNPLLGTWRTFSSSDGLRPSTCTAIKADTAGNTWVGHRSGFSWIAADGSIRQLGASQGMSDVEVLDFDTVEDFHTGETTLWLATSCGVGRIDIGADALPRGKVQWFDMGKRRSERVFTLTRHRDGVLWAGSESGVSFFAGDDLGFVRLKESPEALREVSSIVGSSTGRLFFGTAITECGFFSWNPYESWTLRLADSSFPALVHVDSRNDATWLAARTFGVVVVRPDGAISRVLRMGQEVPGRLVYCITESPQGTVWVGTDQGAAHYSVKDGKFLALDSDAIRGHAVRSICAASNGVVWFGTKTGVVAWDGRAATRFTTEQGLVNNIVQAVHEDKRAGCIWVGTDSGISQLRPQPDGTTAVRNITVADGLPDPDVHALVNDDIGRLWAGTQMGVAVIDGGAVVRTFTPADGLPGNDVRSLGVNSRGIIWAGCNGEGAGAYDGRVWVNTLKQHDRWENLSNRVVHSVGHLGDGTVVLGRPGGLTFLSSWSLPRRRIRFKPSGQDGVSPAGDLRVRRLQLVELDIRPVDHELPGCNPAYAYRILVPGDREEKSWAPFPRADPSRLSLSFDQCGRASVEIVGADVHHKYFEPLTVRFEIIPPWHERKDVLALVALLVGGSAAAACWYAVRYYLQGWAHAKSMEETNRQLAEGKRKADDLLLNILPAKVIEQLQTRGPSATDVFSSLRESRHPWSAPSIAESFHRASILFVDIKNFTRWSATMGPEELVGKLSMIHAVFDSIVGRHGGEKIKTIGDGYMAACGLPRERLDHAHATVQMALDLAFSIKQINLMLGSSIDARFGVNTGPVVAGVTGTRKFIYDIWGDTVNTSSEALPCPLVC